ncbi:hypothetical protein [Bacillus phage vB_BanS-Thrax2]|nr:hypothetical protein [Bacillus phage vB_BanS-Thrax2]
MIQETKVVSQTYRNFFNDSLNIAIQEMQRKGLKVDVQFSTTHLDSTPYVEYHALVLGYSVDGAEG